MTLEPAFEDFARAYDKGAPQLVSTRLVADLETPVSAFLKLSRGREGNVFLLESVEGGAARGRYSMIGLDPDILWRAQAGKAEINRRALTDREAFEPCADRPLDSLRKLIAESAIPATPGMAPMAAGVFGYLGYDMVREMERLAPAKPDPIGTPDAVMMRPTLMAIFDSVRDEISVVTPVRPAPGVSARIAYDRAVERIDALVARLEGPLDHDSHADPHLLATPPVSNTPEPVFLDMVARAKEYIKAGDIFQVVLSQRFTAPFALPAFALYRALRRVNPAPFLCYLDFGPFQVVCSSPEILVRVRDGEVTIRPIAGTRWRGKTPAEDEALAAELLADEKERAEHVMLVDLGRNDLGRVAEYGSVRVEGLMFVERFSHVMHLVSSLKATLRPELDCFDALAATFPAGTLSGAPKVRAMEIIDELEPTRRGAYAGAVMYFDYSGNLDSCIVLRTLYAKGQRAFVQAGGGIVADSVPENEYQETLNKSRALVRAIEIAEKEL